MYNEEKDDAGSQYYLPKKICADINVQNGKYNWAQITTKVHPDIARTVKKELEKLNYTTGYAVGTNKDQCFTVASQ